MAKKEKKNEANTKGNEKNALLKRYGGVKPIPKTTQQTLPYIEAYANGVIQVEPGVFTKMERFDDISFKTKSDDEQEDIYDRYMRFLNKLNPKEDIYFCFVNTVEDEKLKLEKVAPILRGDKQDEYRREITDMIAAKMATTRNNISTKKYILFRVEADSVDKAMQRIVALSGEIETEFKRVTKQPLRDCDLAERLEVMHKIMNSGEKNFWFEHDMDGKPHIDYGKMAKRGLTTKDIIAPEALKFMGNYFQIGERFGQAMYLDNVANWMNSNFLADFCNLNFESVVTMHIEPIPQEDALKKIKEQSVNITAAIMDKQKGAIREGYSPEFLPAHLKNAKEQIDNLQEDLTNRDQKMFYMSLCLMHFADTKEELETNKKVIKNTAAKYMSTIQPLMMQQERGFATALPLGLDKIFAKRPLTTESLGVFIPFDEAVSFEEGGFYYGVNPVNKSLIIHNRLNGMNYNGLVLGASGSGKSFASKREMISAILSTDADIFIIDPDGEYSPLAEAFGGTVVNIAPGNQVHINPLDLDTDTTFDSDLNPMAMKTDFTCGILETMLGNGARLTPTQRSIMDRCIQQIYRPYLEHLQELPPDASGKRRTIDREQCPTFQQLFDALLSQPQPEAQNLALVMETYTTGTFDTFAHRTNQDLNSRLIVYNIKNVGTNLKELALKVCTNDVWNRMVENKRKNKWTWFYIDEFHLLLSNPSTSEFLKSIWKRARKFQGVPTGITQNVEDLLNSPDARTIINNTSFTYLLNQSEMDRRMLTELLKLTENDMEYITHVDPGHGLIVNNGRALPFVDEFPKDTKLYKIMSTKAGES